MSCCLRLQSTFASPDNKTLTALLLITFKEGMRVVWLDRLGCARPETCLTCCILMAVRSYCKQRPVWELPIISGDLTDNDLVGPTDGTKYNTCLYEARPLGKLGSSQQPKIVHHTRFSSGAFLPFCLIKYGGNFRCISRKTYINWAAFPPLPSHHYTHQDKKYIWLIFPWNFTKSFVF